MEIIGYGEDGLTLWAIRGRLDEILGHLEDPSDSKDCRIFYRPSFGRSGGPGSSQFGEFDFLLLSKDHLYLGESKWDRSAEKKTGGILTLRREQLVRNLVFRVYVEEWFADEDWSGVPSRLKKLSPPIDKKVPSPNSLLSRNLKAILTMIKSHYRNRAPVIQDVLLYFHSQETHRKRIPSSVHKPNGNVIDFTVITLDYSEAVIGDTCYLKL